MPWSDFSRDGSQRHQGHAIKGDTSVCAGGAQVVEVCDARPCAGCKRWRECAGPSLRPDVDIRAKHAVRTCENEDGGERQTTRNQQQAKSRIDDFLMEFHGFSFMMLLFGCAGLFTAT